MKEQFKIINNPSLLTIGIAESVSGIGDWITIMSVFAILVFRGGGGVTQSSGVFLAGLVPTLLFSPLAGRLCDRFDRKILMIISQLISGVVIAGLIFTNKLWLIYTLLALQAIAMSIMTPARTSSVPFLVKQEELTVANAFLQQLSSLIKIFAPMLAGLVLTLVNPHTAIVIDVISFGVSALILTRLKPLPPQLKTNPETIPNQAKAEPLITKLKSFFSKKNQSTNDQSFISTLKKSASLQMLYISLFLCIFVIVGFDVLSSVYFRDTLKENESFFGLAISLVGIGSLVATIFLMIKKSSKQAWKDAVTGIALLATIPLAMTVASSIPNLEIARIIVLLFCFIGGIGNGLLNVQASTLLQTSAPSQMLGEASGLLQSTIVTGQLIGTVLTPLIVPGILSMGVYFFFAFIALVLLVSVLVVQLIRSPKNFVVHQTEITE